MWQDWFIHPLLVEVQCYKKILAKSIIQINHFLLGSHASGIYFTESLARAVRVPAIHRDVIIILLTVIQSYDYI